MAARLARVVIPSVTVPVPPTYTDVAFTSTTYSLVPDPTLMPAPSSLGSPCPSRRWRPRPPACVLHRQRSRIPGEIRRAAGDRDVVHRGVRIGVPGSGLPFTVEKAATFLRAGAAGLTEGTSHVKRGAVGRKR